LTSSAICDTNIVFLVTLVDADEQHDLFSFLVVSVPIGDNWSLLAYYGTPGAMYFRQIVPVGLGDDPGKALVVLALAGLYPQAAADGRNRWVLGIPPPF
jgi:hypothetical protein